MGQKITKCNRESLFFDKHRVGKKKKHLSDRNIDKLNVQLD